MVQFTSDLVKALAVALFHFVAELCHCDFDTVALFCFHIGGNVLGEMFLENFIVCVVGALGYFDVNLTFSEVL